MNNMKLHVAILTTMMMSACGGSGGGNGTSSASSEGIAHSLSKPKTSEIVSVHNTSTPQAHKAPINLPKVNQSEDKDNTPKRLEASHIAISSPLPIQKVNPYTDDQTIFRTFNHMPSDLNGNRFVNIELNGQHIHLMPLKESVTINGTHLHTLRDHQGKLFGYYGDATISEHVVDIYNPSEKKANYTYVSLLDYDRSRTPIQPTQDIRYDGTMYYNYIDIPVQSLSATVVAIYRGNDKRLSMEIYNQQDMDLELRENHNTRDVLVLANPNNDYFDNISGKLYNKQNQFVGEFIGGIYGDMAEILIGKTQSREEQGNQAWKGVVGATGKALSPH